MQTFFSQISIPEKPSEVPQAREGILELLPALRPRAIVVRGVHRGAFGEQKICSRDVAIFRRKVQRRFASGGFLRKPVWPLWLPAGDGTETDAVRMTTKVVGMRSSRPGQPTKER